MKILGSKGSPHVRESGKFFLVESEILGFGIRNTAVGIRNPSSTKEDPESSSWNPESMEWNSGSKTLLDSLTSGESMAQR